MINSQDGMDAITIVARALECHPEEINFESQMYDHPGWDSFTQVRIVHLIEEHLGVPIPDDDIMKLTNIVKIRDYFSRKRFSND
jgi:acyl carrier protein